MKHPKITLLPNLLTPEQDPAAVFVPRVKEVVETLDGLIGESPRETRAFLKHFGVHITHVLLNEHTTDIDFILEPILEGQHWGLISDCGLPVLADPGENLIARARQKGVEICALPGPSSITLALLLSGLDAERFTFHGYFPRKEKPLPLMPPGYTHLFIEAPYRNHQTLERLLSHLKQTDLLCIAVDLGGPTQEVIVDKVKRIKKMKLNLDKRPAIFACYQAS